MTATRRVVVTGLGATTPLGGTVAETWDAVLAGRSGARPMTFDWVEKYELPVTFAATIKTPPSEVLSKVETRRLDPSAQYAMIASREAWADAGSPEVEPERLAVAIGTGIGGVWTLLDQWDNLREKGPRRVFPLAVPMLMANSPAGNVSLELGARAGAHSTVSACASGAEAMGFALEMIRSGRADVAVAGGTEGAVHALPIAGFAAMQALSKRNDDPESASRPYDTGRDGFVLGEGAAVLVLESAEHAAARGARVYAKVTGVGLSSDAYHITSPDPEGTGQVAAMRFAIQDAGVTPADIVHVNAHATSTKVGDLTETRSIRTLLGSDADHVQLSATKSMTGHLLGGAGAIESLFAVKAVSERLAPPTINVDNPDPELQVPLVRDEPYKLPGGDIAAINNSFGFGGHNVALVVQNH